MSIYPKGIIISDTFNLDQLESKKVLTHSKVQFFGMNMNQHSEKIVKREVFFHNIKSTKYFNNNKSHFLYKIEQKIFIYVNTVSYFFYINLIIISNNIFNLLLNTLVKIND